MKLDKETGSDNAPATGTERRPPATGAETQLAAETLGRGRREVWTRVVLAVTSVSAVVVSCLVFLFGTDVVGRHGESAMQREMDADTVTAESGTDMIDRHGESAMQREKDADTVTAESTDQPRQRLHATYSFKMAPFVHPKIINDLIGWLSDSGDQVVAINLLDSQDSNRYFGEISVRPQLDPAKPSWPWVYSEDNAGGETDDWRHPPWYGYRYVGSTQDGLDILHFATSGGGSGIFNSIVFTYIEMDHGVSYPPAGQVKSPTAASPEVRVRELIRFVGRIALGDRWQGTIEFTGNDVVVRGRDLYERCELARATMKAAGIEPPMAISCEEVSAANPPPARVYKAPARTS